MFHSGVADASIVMDVSDERLRAIYVNEHSGQLQTYST